MTALHAHQRVILDTLEVFVHEPLMEWLQGAHREARDRYAPPRRALSSKQRNLPQFPRVSRKPILGT